jgi:homospermidine synthase
MIIPHGESYSISNFLKDETTGYVPTQHYVYKINPYAKIYLDNCPPVINAESFNIPYEVIHPYNHKMKGYDKVGALLLFKNNRGWWTGSVMDEFDSQVLLNGKFSPTVLQVAAGCFPAVCWMTLNKNSGCKDAEDLDTDFVLSIAQKYIGRLLSQYVDLKDTHVKDCYKFEDFLCN